MSVEDPKITELNANIKESLMANWTIWVSGEWNSDYRTVSLYLENEYINSDSFDVREASGSGLEY